MAEDNTGGDAEKQFVEVDGEKYQADPDNEGEPLKDDEGNPIPYEEGGEGDEGDEGDEANFIEIDGEKFKADPDNEGEPLKDDNGEPIPYEEKKTKKEEKDDDEEPPVREKDKKNHIINRLRKSRDKKKEKEGDDEIDEDELTDDGKRILKIVDKRYGAKVQKIDEVDNERALDSFFSDPDNEKFKEYESKIRRWWKHPSRNHLPINTVAYEVAGKDLLKIGAKRRKDADEEADKTGSGGHSTRGSMKKKDAWDQTNEEFAKEQEDVRRQQA